jgi:hypothetical protein
MDSDNVIRKSDIPWIIRTDDKPPIVDTLHFQPGQESDARTYGEVLFYIPDSNYNRSDNYYRSPQVLEAQYMNVTEALTKCGPYLKSVDANTLSETDRHTHEFILQMLSGDDVDFSSIETADIPTYIKKFVASIQGSLPPDSDIPKLVKNIYQRSQYMTGFNNGPEIYDEIAAELMKIRTSENGSPAMTELTYQQRVMMHEQTHLADAQSESGRLIDCLRTYDRLRSERNVKGALPPEMDNLRRIHSLLHDVLEARAYVAECTGSLVHDADDSVDRYSHTALAHRLASLLRMTLLLDARAYENAFIHNDPRAIRGVGVIHEEHDGGALLYAFNENIDPDKIFGDLSYDSLIPPEDLVGEDAYRNAVVQKIKGLIQDPEEARKKLESSWDTYGILLKGLVEKFEAEVVLLEGDENTPIPETTT